MQSPVPEKLTVEVETAARQWLPSLTSRLLLIFAGTFIFCFCIAPAAAGRQGQTPDISIVPKDIDDTFDRMRVRDVRNNPPAGQKTGEIQDSCLLPPLTLVRSPVVAAAALAVPAKAKKEYFEACKALQEKKTENAEKHLRKAVQIYSKYSAAWVTLGQMLAAQNHSDEARSACSQASTAEPNYVPAYLCLAELAARDKAWDVVLQLSSQVLALDPISTALAYEYNAAANLRINKLDDAEKSALRALEIDKNNRDPRVHFVLAQIYEAKGDRANEVAQLREYLKLAENPDDVAAVNQYLSQLEKSGASGDPAAQKATGTPNSAASLPAHEPPSTEMTAVSTSSRERTADPESFDGASPHDGASSACNLRDVLPQVERRIQEFVDNVQRFTATEFLEYQSFSGSGKAARLERGKYDYIVSIEESVPGMLAVSEYQNRRSSDIVRPDVVTKGLPALLLIFHPYYAGDFSMRCEGLTILKGNPAWQIRFRQREDKPSRIRSYKMGTAGPAYEVNLQGRAWFAADSYQIVKLEADLIKTIPEIQLTVDHTSAEYGPVHFRSRGIDIWLPQTAELVSERKGKRLHERITFGDYLLFAVDNKQEIASPKDQEWLSGSALCARGLCDRTRLLSSDTLRAVGALLVPD